MSLLTTPSQTVGPYLKIGFDALVITDLAPPGVAGERIVLSGRILDGDGEPVNDGAIEIWQADGRGRYAHPEDAQDGPFRGFGRCLTDALGGYRFTTIRPGRVPGPAGVLQAPHIVVAVFMRGLLKQLITRVYFPDEGSNAKDPVLALVPEERRPTLIARRSAADRRALEWEVILHGEGETVFFDA